jgi:hypothetical protein
LQVKDLIKYSIARLSSWEGIQQLYQEAKYSVTTVVGMPFRVWGMMRQLLHEGCFVIESEFEHDGEAFYIRTFIQPDADVVTIIGIPHLNDIPVRELSVDLASERALMKHYEAHNLKVVEAFEELDGRLDFWGKSIDLTTLLVNVYPMYQAFVEQTQEGVLMAGVTAVGSILFRQFAKKQAINLIVKQLFRLVGRYFAK